MYRSLARPGCQRLSCRNRYASILNRTLGSYRTHSISPSSVDHTRSHTTLNQSNQHKHVISNIHHIPHRSLFGFSSGSASPVRQTIRREVPFPRASMFDVVIDVQSYQSFLPFCTGSRIVKKSRAVNQSDNQSNPSNTTMDEMIAELSIGFRIFTERYTSRVTSIQDEYIHIEAIQSSIFDHLVSEWKFSAVPASRTSDQSEHCMVEFTIDFLASSPIHASAVKMFFTDVTNKQLNAFIERCRVVDQQMRAQQRSIKKTAVPTSPPKTAAVEASKPEQRDEQSDVQVVTKAVNPTSQQSTKPAAEKDPQSSANVTNDSGTHLPPPVFDTLHVKKPVTQTPASVARPVDKPATVKPEVKKVTKAVQDVFCPVQVQLSKHEFEQIRAVFQQFAVPSIPQLIVAQSAADLETTSPSLDQMNDESSADASITKEKTTLGTPFPHVHNGHYIDTYASAPLLLNFAGFQSACAILAAPHKDAVNQLLYTPISRPISQYVKLPVFAKFRERGNLRACAENAEIARAEFTQDASIYQSSPSAGTDSDESRLTSVTQAENKDLPPIPFGRFVEIVHLLSRATVEERLKHTLIRVALAEQATSFDSSNVNLDALTLPISSLRFHTSSFFDVQLGMIRQVMPAMVIKRARELQSDEQASQPASADCTDPMLNDNDADRGVYLLAMIGLMESVLYEIDGAIQDAMRVHSEDIMSANQVGDRVDDSAVHVNVSEWLSWWQSQAELLSVMSVPGMSSLIQWASATKGTNKMHNMRAQR